MPQGFQSDAPDLPAPAAVSSTAPAPRHRRELLAWVLYDFGNSAFAAVVIATIYGAYYALHVVGNDGGAGDLWWGRVVAVSMAVVALTSPFLGAIADAAALRRPLFVGFTLLAVAATALLATVEPGMVAWGFLLAVAGNVGFEGAQVYYNAWLPEIAPRGREGRLSAWGFAVGYAGSIVALVVALPLVRAGALPLAFLTTAVLFAGFALPAFGWLPAPPPARVAPVDAVRGAAASVRAGVGTILRDRELRRFFAAYLLYEDGVNTVVVFSAIFAAQTFGFPLDRLILLYLAVQLAALVGALAWARPTDRLGPRRVVMLTLAQWTVVVVAAALVRTPAQFFVVAVLAGTGLGAVQAASRTLLASLIPRGREAELFGFYALCGKSAAILGPLVFGSISHAAGGNQRLGILAVGAFFLLGLGLLAGLRGGGPVTARETRAGSGVPLEHPVDGQEAEG